VRPDAGYEQISASRLGGSVSMAEYGSFLGAIHVWMDEPILHPFAAAVRGLRCPRAPEASSESSDRPEGQHWDPSPCRRSIEHRRVRRPLAFGIAEGMTYTIDFMNHLRNA
jgi:hypothetical protein